MYKKISYSDLPDVALLLMSKAQRSYIDEFTFFQTDDGKIDAMYAGSIIATYSDDGWREVS